MRKAIQSIALTSALLIICITGGMSKRNVAQPIPASTRQPDAAALWGRRCDSCHGKDGRAKTFKAKFNGARNLTDAKWQAEVTDERLFNSITQGRKKMPAFGRKLSTADIEALVKFVRAFKSGA
jgi:mono/diheme cytochrome c family protein